MSGSQCSFASSRKSLGRCVVDVPARPRRTAGAARVTLVPEFGRSGSPWRLALKEPLMTDRQFEILPTAPTGSAAGGCAAREAATVIRRTLI